MMGVRNFNLLRSQVVLGTLIYEGVKLQTVEDYFKPAHNIHTPLSPTPTQIINLPFLNREPKILFVGTKIFEWGGIFHLVSPQITPMSVSGKHMFY
jgi:hypothetical protein